MLWSCWITTTASSGVGLCDWIGVLCLKAIVTVGIGGSGWGG